MTTKLKTTSIILLLLSTFSYAQDIPLVYNVENTGIYYSKPFTKY